MPLFSAFRPFGEWLFTSLKVGLGTTFLALSYRDKQFLLYGSTYRETKRPISSLIVGEVRLQRTRTYHST